MGTPADEPRTRIVRARLTEKEYLQMRSQMEQLDCLSESRYIRARLLGQRVEIRRDVKLTDRNLRNQINALSTTVAKIGVDYNQATKKFNTLSKMKRPDGSPVINARAANYYLSQVYSQTRDLNAAVCRLIELVDRIDYDRRPHDGASDNQ